MKSFKLLVMLLFVNATIFGQTTEMSKQEISALITNFSAAVETRNTMLLEPMLNENFRVIANRFPTSDKTTVLSRETYLELLKAGKIGGENRTVKVISMDINDHIAYAKVEFESDKAVFTTYQTFLLNANNAWQIVSDMPLVKIK